MKTIKNFTDLSKPEFDAIRKSITDALQAVGQEHGVKIAAGNIRYDANQMHVKVTLTTIDESGEVHNPNADYFRQMAHLIGLSADDLGKTVTMNGRKLIITGYRSGRSAKSIQVKEVGTGKLFVTTPQDVKRALLIP